MKKNILLIESSDSIRKIITLSCQKLKDFVNNLFLSESPEGLLELVDKNKIDLIFTNVEFSDYPDFYVAEELKKKGKTVPVYYIATSRINETLMQMAFHSGGKGMIQPLKNFRLLFKSLEMIIKDEIEDSFFVPKSDDFVVDKDKEVEIFHQRMKESFNDYEKQIMELNEMVISLMIDLNKEKEKTQYWENVIRDYQNFFKESKGE